MPLRPGPDGPTPYGALPLPDEVVAHLRTAAVALGATGRAEELTRVPAVPGVTAPVVVLVGLGERPSPETVRRAVGAAVRPLSGKDAVAVLAPTPDLAGAAAEGALLGAYTVPRLTSGSAPQPVKEVALLTAGARSTVVRAVVARAEALAEGVRWCRDLVNTPPNLLYPRTFAETVAERFAGTGVEVEVLDDEALRAGGFGGIVGVGQGSSRPPRIVRLRHAPAAGRGRRKADGDRVALVGKGITFDSGGLSIKPRTSMPDMKSDMSGAAAVAGTVLAAARLDLPVAVTGYLALAENMPGGNAQRASDVVTMRGGTTVEVIDPDAEGRMVLADAMVLAGEHGADLMVDVATLTGVQASALERIGAVMANDAAFRERVLAAADAAGEEMWPMPLPDHLRPSLDSPVADLKHKGGNLGGMLTAGLFLQEFVPGRGDGEPGIPWAHLDIAGPAFGPGAWGCTPEGGTGYAVRTLLALLEDVAAR
ncbi:leucyl aminopeptidase [Lapillicoccus jejuensis]